MVTMQVTREEFDFVTKILAVFRPEMAKRLSVARVEEPFPGAYKTVDKLLGEHGHVDNLYVRVANAMYLFSQSLAERRHAGSSLADFWEGLPVPNYVVDLVQWSRRDLEAIPNMGRKSVDYLERVLNEAGHKLREGGR
jgi:hypothetical protein